MEGPYELSLTAGQGSWGLGPEISATATDPFFRHGGVDAGFECLMVAYENRGEGAVVMTNARGVPSPEDPRHSHCRNWNFAQTSATSFSPESGFAVIRVHLRAERGSGDGSWLIAILSAGKWLTADGIGMFLRFLRFPLPNQPSPACQGNMGPLISGEKAPGPALVLAYRIR